MPHQRHPTAPPTVCCVVVQPAKATPKTIAASMKTTATLRGKMFILVSPKGPSIGGNF
jgi:hypothetical protein